MHVLTKAFMVVAALLSIALSGLVIAYAANSDKIRQALSNESASVAALEAQVATQSTLMNQENVRLQATIQQLQNDFSALQGQITALQQEKAQLQIEKDRALADKLSAESKISELAELAKTQGTLVVNYREEVTKLRGAELKSKQQTLEMEERLSDLQTQNEVLNQNYRALQEELAQLRQSAQSGQVAGAGTGASDKPYKYSGPLIMGRVESVERDAATSQLMAKLSVGSNDRVARNMELQIIRDKQFIAKIVVTELDLSYSIGVIDTLNRPVEVKAGDIVVSRIQ